MRVSSNHGDASVFIGIYTKKAGLGNVYYQKKADDTENYLFVNEQQNWVVSKVDHITFYSTLIVHTNISKFYRVRLILKITSKHPCEADCKAIARYAYAPPNCANETTEPWWEVGGDPDQSMDVSCIGILFLLFSLNAA